MPFKTGDIFVGSLLFELIFIILKNVPPQRNLNLSNVTVNERELSRANIKEPIIQLHNEDKHISIWLNTSLAFFL